MSKLYSYLYIFFVNGTDVTPMPYDMELALVNTMQQANCIPNIGDTIGLGIGLNYKEYKVMKKVFSKDKIKLFIELPSK